MLTTIATPPPALAWNWPRCTAAMRTAADLDGAMTADLHEEKQKASYHLLNGGGRVGVDLTVDRNDGNQICLVRGEREGAHRTPCSASTASLGSRPDNGLRQCF